MDLRSVGRMHETASRIGDVFAAAPARKVNTESMEKCANGKSRSLLECAVFARDNCAIAQISRDGKSGLLYGTLSLLLARLSVRTWRQSLRLACVVG
jgi:hypothetical protein